MLQAGNEAGTSAEQGAQVEQPGPRGASNEANQGGGFVGAPPSRATKRAPPGMVRKTTAHSRPTVEDVIADRITALAREHWAPGRPVSELKPFDPEVVERVFEKELRGMEPERVAILEFSQYLENYLWRHFSAEKASFAHIMSIVLLINEKFRGETLAVWDAFHSEATFSAMLDRVFGLALLENDHKLDGAMYCAFLQFCVNCLRTLENGTVRTRVLRLFHLPLWTALPPDRCDAELEVDSKLRAEFPAVKRAVEEGGLTLEARFLPCMVTRFFAHVANALRDELARESTERFLELVADLLAQLRTRRFVRPLFVAHHFVGKCELLCKAEPNHSRLFQQLLDRVKFYIDFEVDDASSRQLTDSEVMAARYERLEALQLTAFKSHREKLGELALTNVSRLQGVYLRDKLASLDSNELRALAGSLGVHWAEEAEEKERDELLLHELLAMHEERPSQRRAVQKLALYPTESLLFDEKQVPNERYSGECLPLPKLSLQYLTFHDYFLRNFTLYRLESAYEIREDLNTCLRLLRPRCSNAGQTVFSGWSRFAVPIQTFAIKAVNRPNVGETKPSAVKAEVSLTLAPFEGRIRGEWEGVKRHDVLFLLTVRAKQPLQPDTTVRTPADANKAARFETAQELGLVYVRGCEVVAVLDEQREVVGKRNTKGRVRRAVGNMRHYHVKLDSAQYEEDMQKLARGELEEDVNGTFNLLMRRKPEENNFKAVLSTIRDLLQNEGAVAPPWLREVFLGYGEPASASFWQLPSAHRTLRLHDTLLDAAHLAEAFPHCKPEWRDAKDQAMDVTATAPVPPYEVTLEPQRPDVTKLLMSGVQGREEQKRKEPEKRKKRERPKEEESKEEAKEKEVEERPRKKARVDSGKREKLEAKLAAVKKMNVKQLRAALRSFGVKPLRRKAEMAEQVKKAIGKALAELDEVPEAMEVEAKPVAEPEKPEEVTVCEEVKQDTTEKVKLVVRPVLETAPGLFASHTPKRNAVRFTPMQVEAIRSGLQPGLTVIVGPPGTGKTDVAVQILAELHQNFPEQRTLLITHSNHALNDLFAKLMERSIDERFLLRLGHGEAGLETEKDFSRFGRVNYMLARRLTLLEEVGRVAQAIGVEGAVAYTCETAGYFFLHHVVSLWKKFLAAVSEHKENSAQFVTEHFPFTAFFANDERFAKPLFAQESLEHDLDRAKVCFDHLEHVFEELEDTRAFELLRTMNDRGDYLLTKHAKVIAMTCTHAAIRRADFLKLKLQYDNVIMEEAGQVLEIETSIPLLLQAPDPEFGCRLKRVVLIGDHHQLPPVVQNLALQKFSRLDQSLFTRFVRLGVPVLQLNLQGRMRPSLAELWNWRYHHLGNLPCVQTEEFARANGGLRYDFQFVDVGDHFGRGETTPAPFFYQNLGEAEYMVQMFMLMRLLGYPANRISLLTTYNGQKALLRDIVDARCARNPLYGRPAHISTVDKFQGQQNDFILLSLVRSNHVGHVRDVRRLVVAMSRARLGLYVFGRRRLFENCLELANTFNVLLRRPTQLQLVLKEGTRETARLVDADVPADAVTTIADLTHMGRVVEWMEKQVREHQERLAKQVAEFERAQEEARRAVEREAERKRCLEEEQAQEILASAQAEEIDEKVGAEASGQDLAAAEMVESGKLSELRQPKDAKEEKKQAMDTEGGE